MWSVQSHTALAYGELWASTQILYKPPSEVMSGGYGTICSFVSENVQLPSEDMDSVHKTVGRHLFLIL